MCFKILTRKVALLSFCYEWNEYKNYKSQLSCKISKIIQTKLLKFFSYIVQKKTITICSISILNCTIWSHLLFTKIAHMCMYVPFPFFHNHSTEWQTFFQMRKSTYNTCTNLSNDLWNCSFNRILIINVIAALFCKYTPQLNSNTTVHTHRCVITVCTIY